MNNFTDKFLKYNKTISLLYTCQEIIPTDIISNTQRVYFPSVIKVLDTKIVWHTNNISCLEYIYLPKCEDIGDYFLYKNKILKSISLPKCKSIGTNFLYDNKILNSILLPKCESIGFNFLYDNKALKSILLPECESIGFNFLHYNKKITSISLPKCEHISNRFLHHNDVLESIFLPKCKYVNTNLYTENGTKYRVISYTDATTQTYWYKKIELHNKTKIL